MGIQREREILQMLYEYRDWTPSVKVKDDSSDYVTMQVLERKGLTTTRYEADDTAVWIVGELSQAGKRMMRGEQS